MGMGELQLDIYAQVIILTENKQTKEWEFVAYSTRIWSENSNG